MTTSHTLPDAAAKSQAVSSAHFLQLGAAFFIGAAFLFVVGFAHSQVLHNAAHDTRHAMSFPCH